MTVQDFATKQITTAEAKSHFFGDVPSYGEWCQHTSGRSLLCQTCKRAVIVQRVAVSGKHPHGLASWGSANTNSC